MPAMRLHETCEVDGCRAPHLARGMCKSHYRRQRWADGKDGPNRTSRVPRRWIEVGALANGRPCIAAGWTISLVRCTGVWVRCPSCQAFTTALDLVVRRCEDCDVTMLLNEEELAVLGVVRT